MKRLQLLLLAFLVWGCGDSKEEALIRDYEQTIFGTKVDFNIKFLSIENEGPFSMKDSAEIFYNIGFEGFDKDSLDIQEKIFRDFLKTYENADYDFQIDYMDTKDIADQAVSSIEKYKSMVAKGDEIIGNKYKVIYEADNPLVGRQKIGSYYILDPETSKVLSSERFDL